MLKRKIISQLEERKTNRKIEQIAEATWKKL